MFVCITVCALPPYADRMTDDVVNSVTSNGSTLLHGIFLLVCAPDQFLIYSSAALAKIIGHWLPPQTKTHPAQEADYKRTLSFVRILSFSMTRFSIVQGCLEACAIRFTAPM